MIIDFCRTSKDYDLYIAEQCSTLLNKAFEKFLNEQYITALDFCLWLEANVPCEIKRDLTRSNEETQIILSITVQESDYLIFLLKYA